MEFSREFGLRANIVEKDYVLGWVLAGIFNHPEIGSSWIFKGGTCLKKCFFETYRFSEDLDFTLLKSSRLDQEFLVSCFQEIAQWVYEETGIEIPQDLIRFDVYQNNIGAVIEEFFRHFPDQLAASFVIDCDALLHVHFLELLIAVPDVTPATFFALITGEDQHGEIWVRV